MPTYEYRCSQGHRFESFQRMSDPPLTTCPTCGADAERILSSGAGFLFKGSGFYITDYRSNSYQEGAKRDSADVSAASPGSSSAPSTPPPPSPTPSASSGSGGSAGSD
jgi:putative FmdB family regulatory protein